MSARILRLTERFDWAVRKYGVTGGTPGGRVLFALLRSMQTEDLPGRDSETMFPPVMRYWFRRVPGHNLWLFYSFSDTELRAVGLTRSPPVPYDD